MAKTLTASDAKPAAGAQPGTARKKSSKKGLLLVVLLLVLLGGGGGAGWWFFLRAPATADKEVRPAAPKAPIFLNLEPFTVNLQEENGDHYLQVGIVYQVADDKIVESAKVYMPILRNRILLLLSAKHPSELSTLEGKNKLVAELIAAARESLPGNTPDRGVVGAYLGAFVIQ